MRLPGARRDTPRLERPQAGEAAQMQERSAMDPLEAIGRELVVELRRGGATMVPKASARVAKTS